MEQNLKLRKLILNNVEGSLHWNYQEFMTNLNLRRVLSSLYPVDGHITVEKRVEGLTLSERRTYYFSFGPMTSKKALVLKICLANKNCSNIMEFSQINTC